MNAPRHYTDFPSRNRPTTVVPAGGFTGLPATKLSEAQRQAIWRRIKRSDLALSSVLSGPVAAALRAAFGASPVFERSLIAAAEADAHGEPR